MRSEHLSKNTTVLRRRGLTTACISPLCAYSKTTTKYTVNEKPRCRYTAVFYDFIDNILQLQAMTSIIKPREEKAFYFFWCCALY